MEKTPRILVVGSFVMDLIVGADRFPEEGESVIGNHFSMASGGKGANQAVQAARLGARVDMVGKVGNDDFGTRLIESAADAGVDVSRVLRSADKPSAIGNVQLANKNGQSVNRICVVPGANMDIKPEDIAFLSEEISKYDMVILQFEIPMEINIAVARLAYEHGVAVMVNTAPFAPIPDELLPLISYISPNEHEASLLTGIDVTDVESAKIAAEKLLGSGVKNVIITLGSRGALFANKDEVFFSPSVKGVNAVDPTAAGDSFVGAFCTATCSGLVPEKAMAFANCTAAVTVSHMGAQPSLPFGDAVSEVVKKVYGTTDGFEPLV